MKRTSEEAQQTRAAILDVAFSCFFETGFRGTSLDYIAKKMNMTRGAIYWHFKNKEELYREVVQTALSEADVVSYAYTLDSGLSFKERMYEIFWFAQDGNTKVEFIYKTLTFISNNDQFKDLLEMIKEEKVKLFHYFIQEIRQHASNIDKFHFCVEDYAAGLFLQFEGLFLTKNIPIGIKTTKAHIQRYVDNIIHEIC